ncbi:6-pyruvoyl tetrahydropterin synthase family protein [Candidatus Omnitrophota bacterium]
MFELKVIAFFSAAHSLRGYKGNCEAVHGHNWKIEVIVERADLDKQGLALDFHELKALLKGALEELDHKDLNQIDSFTKVNPSSESIAQFIYLRLKSPLQEKGCRLKKVVAWEQRDSAAAYYED